MVTQDLFPGLALSASFLLHLVLSCFVIFYLIVSIFEVDFPLRGPVQEEKMSINWATIALQISPSTRKLTQTKANQYFLRLENSKSI